MTSLVQPVDWLAVGPPLVVALTAVAALVASVVAPATAIRRGLVTWLSLGGLVVALLLLLPLLGTTRSVFCAPDSRGAGEACSYVVDTTTLVFQLVAAGGAALVVLLSATATWTAAEPARPETSSTDAEVSVDGGTSAGHLPTGEYHFLLLASAAGAMTIAGARDLVTLVVALELVSLPAFALVGLRRDRRSAEAALKFFLVSVVSVAVMLLGVSLVYGVTGAVHFDRIAAALASESTAAGESRLTGVAAVGVVLTLVGLAFKVSAVPFHFWVPDTYVGAPVAVAAYLSVVSKGAGLVGLLLVVSLAFPSYAGVWSPIVGVLAAVTVTVGNLVALRQQTAVRLLAWSSIAQAGYLLVPLGAVSAVTGSGGVTSAGGRSADVAEVLAATVAYLLIYAVLNLGAFGVVTSVIGSGTGAEGRGVRLEDYRGMIRRDPARAVALAFFLLALAGLPPGVAGLFAKVVIFRAAVESGAGWLAVVVAVNVVIGLAYYLPWTARLFMPAVGTAPSTDADHGRRVPWPAMLAIGVTAVLGIVLSVAPGVALDVLPQLPLALSR
ncbi:NADH-quinone oxidoreductase subunit N [Thermasporomyces composti]|uniref:NADH-quinone oxidoreductase subunit N n=1 Tax=Thermasporomyces composti TaxID=696763 RepID=A0A3D9V754_THECX|nr:NADH-quinone oxidoreductase subunit N [Thermasporomyces composti]REF37146.1 NADH-quinone oxidoreductase subunit N [Thermasporomyces composti]